MNRTLVLNKLTAFAGAWSGLFNKISGPVTRILTFNLADERIYPAKTLSASLDKGALSVAYGIRFLSGIKIRGVREYSFEEGRYPNPEVFASSLALAINDLGAEKAGVSLSIPKAWAVIKTSEFPITVKENLSNVISYELDRITPFSSSDAFYDFKILKEEAGKITVMVVAAKADSVRPYIDALKEKDIIVGKIGINLSGFETLCRYIDGADKIFIDIMKKEYEGALFLNGSITGVFTGNFSTEDRLERIETVMAEINPLIDAMKSYGKTPKVVAHLRDADPEVKELLKTQIKQPLGILNETDIKIRLSGHDKVVPYAAIGGLLDSLWPKAAGLNLLKKGYHERSKSPKGLTIILLLLILAVWILYLVSPLRVEERRLQEIDRQIMIRKEEVKKVEALKKDVESLNKEISTITDFKENRPMTLNILKELTTILPKNTWLSRLRVTQTTVEIEGYAASATGLLPKLEASKYFQKAEFSSPTFRDTRMNADRFNIKMEIKGVKKEGVKAGANEGQE
jgi:Tfp pilus assembly protein PilN